MAKVGGERTERPKVIFVFRTAETASCRSGPLFGSENVYTAERILKMHT